MYSDRGTQNARYKNQTCIMIQNNKLLESVVPYFKLDLNADLLVLTVL